MGEAKVREVRDGGHGRSLRPELNTLTTLAFLQYTRTTAYPDEAPRYPHS